VTVLDTYLQFLRERKSKKTVKTYQRGAVRWERFVAECHPEGSLEGTPIGFMDKFVSYLLAEKPPPAPATIRLYVSGSRSYLSWRRRMGESIPEYLSPHMPKVRPKEHFSLNAEQLREYLALSAHRPDPARTILILLPFCGLRSEEILSLKRCDLYPAGSAIVFRVVHGKGGKSRDVPLLVQGNGVLRQYLTGWRSLFPREEPWIFPGSRKGEHLHTRTLRHHMNEVRKEMSPLSGHLTPHILRKTYAVFLDRAKLSQFTIAQLLGHASPRTSHETYIHHEVGTLIEDLEQVNLPAPNIE